MRGYLSPVLGPAGKGILRLQPHTTLTAPTAAKVA
jgi:hypothetical protein